MWNLLGIYLSDKPELVKIVSLITAPGVMEQLDVGIVPYIVLLVVPVLGRMSDQTNSVRFMATQCFATLIRLMPLEVSSSCKYVEYVNCPGSTLSPAAKSRLLAY